MRNLAKDMHIAFLLRETDIPLQKENYRVQRFFAKKSMTPRGARADPSPRWVHFFVLQAFLGRPVGPRLPGKLRGCFCVFLVGRF